MTLRGGGPPRRLVGRRIADDGAAGYGRNGAQLDDVPRAAGDPDAFEPDDAELGDDGGEEYASRYDDPEYFRGSERRPAWRSHDSRRRYSSRSGSGQLVRFLLFAAVLATIVVGGMYLVARPIAVRAIVNWGAENRTALGFPFVADIVRGELGQYLTAPAGTDASDVTFVVTPGETPRQIAEALVQAGLLKNDDAAQAFVFQSIVSDASSSFLAGTHTLRKNMTPMQIIAALQQAPPVRPVIKVTFREGLRLEQMVALLEHIEANPTDPTHPLHIDVDQFYQLVTKPPTSLTSKYAFLRPGVSLEGFMFPATYDLYSDSTAEDLVTKMLDAFKQNAPPELLKMTPDGIAAMMELASLTELEVKRDVDRAPVAGVYTNRLDKAHWPTGLLNSNPSVTYAVDSVWLAEHSMSEWVNYTFWVEKQGPTEFSKMDFPENLAPYNTYRHPGLPPTPICSPSLASINAALAPDTKDGYYYFLATKDGTVVFAHTLEEQVANEQKYGLLP